MENLDLKNLSNNEKLELIEELWDSIDNPDELVPFNPIHKKIIDDRLNKINDNTEWFTLEELKKTLRSLYE